MAGCCESGNEPSVSIKCGKSENLLSSHEGLRGDSYVIDIHK